ADRLVDYRHVSLLSFVLLSTSYFEPLLAPLRAPCPSPRPMLGTQAGRAGTQIVTAAGSTSTLNAFSFGRSLPSSSYRTFCCSFTWTERAFVMCTNGDLDTCFRVSVLAHCLIPSASAIPT